MMNLSNTVLTLATPKELQDLMILSVVGRVTDDILSTVQSNSIYRVVMAIETEISMIEYVCDKRVDRIIELCLTGK